VAAPLLQNGQVVGSLSLTDTVERINEKNYRKFAEALKEKAEFISRQL
jgi:DNA-binding IclR family transcriptional regulator